MDWTLIDQWLESTDHKYDCAAYDEGQFCCLEKPEVRAVLERLIKETLLKSLR